MSEATRQRRTAELRQLIQTSNVTFGPPRNRDERRRAERALKRLANKPKRTK